MSDYLISIIVPVYNVENQIERCIKSLLSQTYKNIEIILIDDGSTDNSYNICSKYADIDKRIKLIHQENSGVSKARNTGIEICKGDYIGFVDSDDYIEPTMYNTLLKKMLLTNSKLGICNYYYETPSAKKIKNYHHCDETFSSQFLPKYMITFFSINGYLCNKLYKRDLIIKNDKKVLLPSEIKILEDNMYNYEIYNLNEEFNCVYTDEVLYHYVQYKNSAFNKKYNLDKLQYFVVRNRQIEILENKGLNADFLKADYIFNFTKDQFKIKYLKLELNSDYQELEKKNNEYLNTIKIENLEKRMKLKHIICKRFPFLLYLIIIIKKENL